MTWTAPPVPRDNTPRQGTERELLQAWLEFHRRTLLGKCAGLTGEQLRTAAVPPSDLTLLGLVRHMTDVERWWFRTVSAREPVADVYYTDDNPDADFLALESVPPAEALTAFTAECAAADAAVAALPLDSLAPHPTTGVETSLRWVYLHMVEEYARHNGHADLIRERIDGATGD
ncbi:MAG TPA: DinB family protein [Pilimelia sp.]|nr:DinB family protein [Pilimelia sp.]